MSKELPNHWIVLTTAILLIWRHVGLGLDIKSLLILFPWLVCSVPTFDSIQGQRRIRVWNKWRMKFESVNRDGSPFDYWLNVVIAWPASAFFAYALVMMPK